MQISIYGVFDGDELIFKGTRKEISQKFDVKCVSMSSYTSQGVKLKGLYTVRKVGYEERELEYNLRNRTIKRVIEPTKELSYRDNPFECLVWHLRAYGNTSVSSFNPTQYVDDLKKLGIRVLIKEMPNEYVDDSLQTTRNRHRKGVHWYVEVADAKRKRKSVQKRT